MEMFYRSDLVLLVREGGRTPRLAIGDFESLRLPVPPSGASQILSAPVRRIAEITAPCPAAAGTATRSRKRSRSRRKFQIVCRKPQPEAADGPSPSVAS